MNTINVELKNLRLSKVAKTQENLILRLINLCINQLNKFSLKLNKLGKTILRSVKKRLNYRIEEVAGTFFN